jgi:Putative prokaryotic signal transducing protein
MITVAKFFKSEDAHLFRSLLESEGIAAHVLDEHISQWFWQNTLAFGGVRVAVADEDSEHAEQLYVEYNESMKTAPFVERPVRAWPIVVLLSLIAGVPLILLGRKSKVKDDHDTDA